jgi:hypothetical protein
MADWKAGVHTPGLFINEVFSEYQILKKPLIFKSLKGPETGAVIRLRV